MGERTTYQGDGGDGRLSSDSLATESRRTPVYTISQATHDVVFSPPPLHGFSFPFASSSSSTSPPTYSQLSASRAVHSSTSGSRVIASTHPPPPPPPAPFHETEDDRPRVKSSLGSLNSRAASSKGSVGGALDSGSSEWKKGQRLQRSQNNNAEVVNSSSTQSSAPNSSFEVELETADQEASGGPGARGGRRLNNTPVDLGASFGPPAESVLARRPGRLNLEGGGESSWQTAPGGTRTETERPITPGARRFAGAESITRPFGLGTVTVTPLYRPPKTPPSRRHQEVILDVTSRDFDAHRATVRTPDSHRASPSVRTPDSLKSFRIPVRHPVPHMSATPFPRGDRETEISVCQSDVTVYDNIDSVRV